MNFKVKKSARRKFCCKACFYEYSKGKHKTSGIKKVEVKCANCGKIEYVNPCRARIYQCCSKECQSKLRKITEPNCTCIIYGTKFYVKPSRIKRVKTQICCSRKCSDKLRETTYLGEHNHQWGLIGNKNSSFNGNETISNYGYILEYCPGHPKPCDRNSKCIRVRQHRLVIEQNYKNFDPKYFEEINGWIVLKDEYDVHHINEIKTDNRLENLQIVTKAEHRTIHNILESQKIYKHNAIVGVLKQDELLETPEVDNQQPSLNSNILEGSTTNSRVQTDNAEDSNTDTSVLIQ